MATRKPRPSSCRRRSRPTRAPSIARSEVVDELRPSFSSSRVTRTCSASSDEARDAARARGRRIGTREEDERPGARAVRDPLLRAVEHPAVAVRLRGRPQRAGVGAGARLGERERSELLTARERWHERERAARRCRKRGSGSVVALVCTATVTPTPASARESSSSTRTYERKSAPAPPYSSGTHTPMSPSSASFGKSSSGKRCSRSQSAAFGTISASANSRVSAWIAR